MSEIVRWSHKDSDEEMDEEYLITVVDLGDRYYNNSVFGFSQTIPINFKAGVKDILTKFDSLEKYIDAHEESQFDPEVKCSLDVSLEEALYYPRRISDRIPLNYQYTRQITSQNIKTMWCRLVAHYFEYLYGIPEIKKLSDKDKIRLVLRQLCRTICFSLAYRTYRSNMNKGLKFGGGIIYVPDNNTDVEVLQYVNELERAIHILIIAEFRNIKITEQEYILAKLICLFSDTEQCGLSDHGDVICKQSVRRYSSSLIEHIRENNKVLTQGQVLGRMQSIMAILPQLDTVSEVDDRHLMDLVLRGGIMPGLRIRASAEENMAVVDSDLGRKRSLSTSDKVSVTDSVISRCLSLLGITSKKEKSSSPVSDASDDTIKILSVVDKEGCRNGSTSTDSNIFDFSGLNCFGEEYVIEKDLQNDIINYAMHRQISYPVNLRSAWIEHFGADVDKFYGKVVGFLLTLSNSKPLPTECFYLAVYYIHSLTQAVPPSLDDFEAIILAALNLAAKVERQHGISKTLFSNVNRKLVCSYERQIMLAVEDFNLCPTTLPQMRRFYTIQLNKKKWSHVFSKWLCDLSQFNLYLVQIPDTLLGAVIMRLIANMQSETLWNEKCYAISRHDEAEFAVPHAVLCRLVLTAQANGTFYKVSVTDSVISRCLSLLGITSKKEKSSSPVSDASDDTIKILSVIEKEGCRNGSTSTDSNIFDFSGLNCFGEEYVIEKEFQNDIINYAIHRQISYPVHLRSAWIKPFGADVDKIYGKVVGFLLTLSNSKPLPTECFYLAVYYIHSLTQAVPPSLDDFEAIILAALNLAAKVERQHGISKTLFSNVNRKLVCSYERQIMLAVEDFNMCPTTLPQMRRFYTIQLNKKKWSHVFSKWLCDLSQFNLYLVQIPDTLLGAVIMRLIANMQSETLWNEKCYAISRHDEAEFAVPHAVLCRLVLTAQANGTFYKFHENSSELYNSLINDHHHLLVRGATSTNVPSEVAVYQWSEEYLSV